MPRPIINGSLNPVRQSIKSSFSKSNGLTTVIEWAAPGDNLTGYANVLRQNGIQHDHTFAGGRSILIETASGGLAGVNDVATDRWELMANENMLDVKEHHNWVNLSDQTKALILRDVNRHLDKGKAPTREWLETEPTAEDRATATSFYEILVRGSSHFPVYNWVLRHTTSVSAEYTQNVADNGVNTIFTTAQLISEIGNSSYWIYPAPPRFRSKVGGLTFGAVSGLTNGWLKKPSQESTGANNRIDISTEYVFAQWASIIYS
jgi:hypothetical protein